MFCDARLPWMFGAVVAIGFAAAALGSVATASAREPANLAGSWDLSFGKTATGPVSAICRVLLRPDRSDKGDYFLGMPSACRHSMPGIASLGRWSMPDDSHLTLNDPGGKVLLALDAAANAFTLTVPDGFYTLRPVAAGRSAAGFETVTPATAPAVTPLVTLDTMTPPAVLPVQSATPRRARAEPAETAADLAGRYAIMREKHDTGCMLTLDKTHGKGGDRAQLAPGCRDQGIVVFDPTAWQIVRGDLVLTARAGHKTKLEKGGDGAWTKDPKEGGKPLGLKKL